MDDPALILVLGDQMTPGRGALRDARPGVDTIVMAEVHAEATYVPHNRHKIALIFAAMRHFRDELRQQGFDVHYFEYGEGLATLSDAVQRALRDGGAGTLRYTQPGSTVCSTSVALPAVPTAKRYSPPLTVVGMNVSSAEPIASPVTRAAPTSTAAFTAVRC